jgi:DNA-binding response OmpR family regulator
MTERSSASTSTTAVPPDQPVVLVVDDDEDLADTYALWLENEYETRTAYSGEEAIEQLDPDIDIVLLDRRMPSVPGDEVLEAIRERGVDCRVSMLTAVEPDSDIVDLPFDEYLVKPVTKSEVVDVVDELLLRDTLDEEVQEYLAMEATEETLGRRDVEEFRDPDAVAELREAVESAAEEEVVKQQVAELNRLKRLNELIRSVDEALVDASSREGIEASVCTRLVENGPYEFAWIGSYVGAFDELAPRAANHEEGTDLGDGVDLDEGVVAEAIRSESAVTVSAADSAAVGAVFDRAGIEDDRAGVAVPLTYRDTVYGVLVVAVETGRAVSERELEVLDELGDSIANAINAVESKRLLFADTVVELELQVGSEDVVVDLAGQLDATVDLEGFVPANEDGVTCYLTVKGAAADDVSAVLAASPAVASHRGISEGSDAAMFEATLTDDSVVLTLLGAGANPRTMLVEDGEGFVTAEVAPEADPRTVLEAVRSAFPGTDLVAKREAERSIQSTERFRQELSKTLTDRQQSVLEATFNAGYFEWPRESTAEEVAEALDLAPPTLHEHLREAQRKLIARYLDEVE